jgi:hypothetical protein
MGKYIDNFKVFEAREQQVFEKRPPSADELRAEIDKIRAARLAKQNTPEGLKDSATDRVLGLFPGAWKFADIIKSVTDQSDDQNGTEFQFDMEWGDTLQLVRNENVYGKWDIYLNGKMMSPPIYDATPEMMKKIKPLDRYLYFVPSYDSTWEDSRDRMARNLGKQEQDNLRSLYAALSAGDKKKAYAAFKDKFKIKTDFNEFIGA